MKSHDRLDDSPIEGKAVEYLLESGASIHRRRRRRRAAITMTVVSLLLLGTFGYATAYVQGWLGASASRAPSGSKCRTATSPRAVAPHLLTTNVYNATIREGLAASVAESLQKLGFKVAAVGNDPLSRTVLGVGEIRTGPTGAVGALLLATRLPGAVIVPDGRSDDSVDVVLGNKFKRLSTPRKGALPTATPRPTLPPELSCPPTAER